MLAPVIQVAHAESRIEQELRRFTIARQAEREATIAAEKQSDLARLARVEQGRALLAIRDNRLHGIASSFEHFCETRIGIGKAHAYRLIEYASIVDNLSPKDGLGDELSTAPPPERTLRPLARLSPEDQPVVFSALLQSSEPITGASVQAAVRRHLGEDHEQQDTPSSGAADVTHVMLKVPLDAIEEAAESFASGMPVHKLEQFARLLLKHAKHRRGILRDQRNAKAPE